MTTATKEPLITDEATLEAADDTFTRRAAAIEKAEEALKQIRQIGATIREAADLLEAEDPLVYKILSYPMSFDDLAASLRDDITEWAQEQDDLEREIEYFKKRRWEHSDI